MDMNARNNVKINYSNKNNNDTDYKFEYNTDNYKRTKYDKFNAFILSLQERYKISSNDLYLLIIHRNLKINSSKIEQLKTLSKDNRSIDDLFGPSITCMIDCSGCNNQDGIIFEKSSKISYYYDDTRKIDYLLLKAKSINKIILCDCGEKISSKNTVNKSPEDTESEVSYL